MMVPADSDPGSGTLASVSEGYDSVYVTTRKTGIGSTTEGIVDYELNMYMSHLMLTDYLVDCNKNRTKEAVESMLEEYILTAIVIAVSGSIGGTILEAALEISELGSYIMDYQFYCEASDLYYDDKKAIVTISDNAKSIEEWTSNCYTYLDAHNSFYIYSSEVQVFKNRK